MSKYRCSYCGELLFPKDGWLYCQMENIYYCPECGKELEINFSGNICKCGYSTNDDMFLD